MQGVRFAGAGECLKPIVKARSDPFAAMVRRDGQHEVTLAGPSRRLGNAAISRLEVANYFTAVELLGHKV